MDRHDSRPKPAAPRVGFFVTCLANAMRPSVAFASVKLLLRAGCRVEVPEGQVCCGQPAFNSGDTEGTRAIARQVIALFEGYDHVVGPSGSCMATIRHHYPGLFADEPAWRERAQRLAERSWELTSFLVDVMGVEDVQAQLNAQATYHDSCSGLRELGIKQQPRRLLKSVRGLELTEMKDSETCCGFGGTFCVKYPEISAKMVDDKAARVQQSGADVLVGGDLGCLLNMAGRLKRLGRDTRVYHVAEVLAGVGDTPGIGDAAEAR
ncbi:MAG TPA: (Fe-S)-binding protein [Albitalea sp.]